MPSLKMEIFTLKKEISSLGEIEGQGPIKRDKQKKLDLLQNFQESIEAAQEKIAKEGITDYMDKQAIYGQAKKDFQKYLGYLAKKNDTILFDDTADEAFAILTDNLEMRDQRQGLALSINVLNSPKGFLNLQNRVFDALTKEASSETRLERIKDNIMKFYMMNDENEIIQTLGKLGLKLPEDFIEQYKTALEKGEELPIPEMYLDPSTGKEIDYFSDPDRYLKADELWQAFRYWMQENRKKTPEEIAAEQKKAADAVAAMQFNEKVLESYPKQLADNLKAMHKSALESGDIAKDQTLQEYVETNPNALQEIKLYKMQIAQQTDWATLVENAVSEKELNAVMEQIDKVNAMTPDLLTSISKKRDSFKQAESVTLTPEIEKQLNNLGYSKEDISKMSAEEIKSIIDYDNQIAKGTQLHKQALDIKAMGDTLKTLPFDTINKLGKLLGVKGAFKEIEDVAEAVANAYYTTKNEELIKAVDAELAALEGKPVEKETTTTLEWKPGPIPEGNTYDLGAGRTAVYNKERGYWEFRRKDGKVIKDKKTIQKLAQQLSDKQGIISFWWNNLLTEEQKEKVTADINRYADLSSQAQGAVNLENASEIFLMKELQGVKFAPSSLKGQVTDVNMKAWTKEGSKYRIDTIISEEDAATISIPLEDIPDKILALVEAYPNGIKNSDIDQRLRELNPDTELNDLKKDFINAYGLDLERVFFYKLDVVEEPPVTKTYEDFFNESSIPEKFTTIVNELKDHNILQGTLTQDFPWESNKLNEEYRYQVTLDDGRQVPVTSAYYFNKDISTDVFRNNPRVRLVLTEFNGKPAVEVRTMEPGVEDKQLTYIRESKEVKLGKPITFPIYNDDLLQEPAPEDTTIEEINKNISQPTLLLAWGRGYDAIYNDVQYFITKVTDKTVSLRTINDKTITVNISDIKEVRDGKGLIKSKIDAEMAKLNQTAVKNVLTSLDDTINITTAAKNIKDNKC